LNEQNEFLDELSLNINDNMASNSWVVHGNHTENGMPILSNDPHLAAGLPSFWILMELNWGTGYMTGGSHPGVPEIMMGRSEHIQWGITSGIPDVSDLWVETISDDGLSYLVDGEWRPLRIIDHEIKVKG
jgi:penicillin amidase